MNDSPKLLSIAKQIEELSLFEKLFLFDRIWKELELAVDGFMITCVSNEHIMAEVMEHCDDDIELDPESNDDFEWPSNVSFISPKDKPH